jgi:hypothetical protein
MIPQTVRIPKKGTRARAVYDVLDDDACEGILSSWSDCRDAYCSVEPRMDKDQARWAGLNIGRLLRKYAVRYGRGRYRVKTQYEIFGFFQ